MPSGRSLPGGQRATESRLAEQQGEEHLPTQTDALQEGREREGEGERNGKLFMKTVYMYMYMYSMLHIFVHSLYRNEKVSDSHYYEMHAWYVRRDLNLYRFVVVAGTCTLYISRVENEHYFVFN